MRLGRVVFTFEALAQALGVPEGHSICYVLPQDATEMANQLMSIVIEGPTMPEHWEGSQTQIVDMPRLDES